MIAWVLSKTFLYGITLLQCSIQTYYSPHVETKFGDRRVGWLCS